MRRLVLQLLAWILLPTLTVFMIASVSPHGLAALMVGGIVLGALGCLAVLVRFIMPRTSAHRRAKHRATEGGLLGLLSLPIAGLIFERRLTFADDAFQLALIFLLIFVGMGVGIGIGRLPSLCEAEN